MAGDSRLVLAKFMGEERLVEEVVVPSEVVTVELTVVATEGGGEGGVTLTMEGKKSPLFRGIERTGLAAEPTAWPHPGNFGSVLAAASVA